MVMFIDDDVFYDIFKNNYVYWGWSVLGLVLISILLRDIKSFQEKHN